MNIVTAIREIDELINILIKLPRISWKEKCKCNTLSNRVNES